MNDFMETGYAASPVKEGYAADWVNHMSEQHNGIRPTPWLNLSLAVKKPLPEPLLLPPVIKSVFVKNQVPFI